MDVKHHVYLLTTTALRPSQLVIIKDLTVSWWSSRTSQSAGGHQGPHSQLVVIKDLTVSWWSSRTAGLVSWLSLIHI